MAHGESEEEENDSTHKLCLLPMEDLLLRKEELFCLAGTALAVLLLVALGRECRWKLFRLATGVLATAFARSAMRVSRVARLGVLESAVRDCLAGLEWGSFATAAVVAASCGEWLEQLRDRCG